MNRKQAKKYLPIMQAFAEGKIIQVKIKDNLWYELDSDEGLIFNRNPKNYRVKPEPKYRPFKNEEECWEEMQKHQPFSWIKASHGQFSIIGIRKDDIILGVISNELTYNYVFSNYKFLDGTPFGIKIE